MKIRNKLTGEVVTIRRSQPQASTSVDTSTPKEDYLDMTKRVGQDIQSDITKRGDYLMDTAADMASLNPMRKGLGVLKTAGMPMTSVVSGISNPMLQMQQGNFNPSQLAEEAYKGFTLQKQGRLGDVYRGAGMEKNAAGLLGFGVEMLAPAAALSRVNKFFGKLTTKADLKMEGASEDILKAGEQALSISGTKINQLLAPYKNVSVYTDDALDAIKDLPKAVVDKIKKEVPEINEVGKFTIDSLRRVKQVLGKYAPSKFNKGTPEETIATVDYNEAYGKLANAFHKAVRGATKTSKEADDLIKAENIFTKITRAESYLRNKLIDRNTQFATRGGELSKSLKNPYVSTPRKALDILKTAGGDNRALIGGAEASMNSFNRWLMMKGLTQHAGSAALFGGAIGGIGGYVGGKLYKRDGGE
jgi:hypothetical protein